MTAAEKAFNNANFFVIKPNEKKKKRGHGNAK